MSGFSDKPIKSESPGGGELGFGVLKAPEVMLMQLALTAAGYEWIQR